MVDLDGNVGETISRYHDHMNEKCAIIMCDVCDVQLTTFRSLTVGAGHVRRSAILSGCNQTSQLH